LSSPTEIGDQEKENKMRITIELPQSTTGQTQMIDEYYGFGGWDENGVPKPESLKKMGIDKEPTHLL